MPAMLVMLTRRTSRPLPSRGNAGIPLGWPLPRERQGEHTRAGEAVFLDTPATAGVNTVGDVGRSRL